MNLLNAGWSFFGYTYGGDGLTGSGKIYLGLQGLAVYPDSPLTASVFGLGEAGTYSYVPWVVFANGDNGIGYSNGNFATSCQIAGETAFALTLTAIMLTTALVVLSLNRLAFSNTAVNKGWAVFAAFFSVAVSVTAFSNWHVNCYLDFRNNFQNWMRTPSVGLINSGLTVNTAITSTTYEYYGFNVVVVAFVFSIVSMVLHIAAPTAGGGGSGSAPEKAIEAA